MDKIRVAFIKFAGLCSGGTDKYLQAAAANLSRDKFEVDFYYCDAAPYVNNDYKHPDTDPDRLKFMHEHNVNLIKFNVGFKDVTKPTHDWLDTNFWDLFKEDNYDVIVSGRAGHPEYPFNLIKNTPIVDTLHLNAGADNQNNIKKVVHLSEWHAKKWIKTGGDRRRVEIVPQPLSIHDFIREDLRKKMGLENKFIFGFHQRSDDHIFSPIPLLAYSKIETPDTYFVLLNGSPKYQAQAKQLGLKNVSFLPFAKTMDDVYNFLEMLDVFAHGRRDGETSGAAIAEAMAFGLPVISHYTPYNNGHAETIGPAGKMVFTASQYAKEMRKLMNDQDYYKKISAIAKQRFIDRYSFERQIKKIENIITEAATGNKVYTPWHWSAIVGRIYQLKFAMRCRLVGIVKTIAKKIGVNI